jgi:riboflavin synthase
MEYVKLIGYERCSKMFTGIVDHCGKIKKIETDLKGTRVVIETNFSDLTVGESIAVDGICLTVVSHEENQFTVDISPETMCLTTVSYYVSGMKVNLERSLCPIRRLDGHFVTGHIDGCYPVNAIISHGEYTEIEIAEILPEYRPFMVKKGSIAVNGVSLTLNSVEEDSFKVMLIPHTLQRTNLSQPSLNKVNIEFDYLAKLIFKQLNSGKI